MTELAAVTLPLRTVNGDNAREHWAARARRAKAHRGAARLALAGSLRRWGRASGLVITLTRVAPRELDDDGLRSALKAVRDGVADALGLPNDRDSRVAWRYLQRRGAVREYAVRVEVQEVGQ